MPITDAEIPWTIRAATAADLPSLFRLFDDAVLWLVARGLSEQWGTTSVSSRPHLVEEINGYLGAPYLATVAESKILGHVIGFIALEFPSTSQNANAGYVHSLVADRNPAARGAGAELLGWAEKQTRESGRTILRLHCRAGNPKLAAYYASQGFLQFADPVPDPSTLAFEKRLTLPL